jgi:hypothetical protein
MDSRCRVAFLVHAAAVGISPESHREVPALLGFGGVCPRNKRIPEDWDVEGWASSWTVLCLVAAGLMLGVVLRLLPKGILWGGLIMRVWNLDRVILAHCVALGPIIHLHILLLLAGRRFGMSSHLLFYTICSSGSH